MQSFSIAWQSASESQQPVLLFVPNWHEKVGRIVKVFSGSRYVTSSQPKTGVQSFDNGQSADAVASEMQQPIRRGN